MYCYNICLFFYIYNFMDLYIINIKKIYFILMFFFFFFSLIIIIINNTIYFYFLFYSQAIFVSKLVNAIAKAKSAEKG